MSDRWTISIGAAPLGTPVLAEDRIGVATTDGRLLVVDMDDGEILWDERPPGGIAGGITWDRFVIIWAGTDRSLYRTPLDDFITATDIEIAFVPTIPPCQHPTRQRTFFAGRNKLACMSGDYKRVPWQIDVEGDPAEIEATESEVFLVTSAGTWVVDEADGNVLRTEPATPAPATHEGDSRVVWRGEHDGHGFYLTEDGTLGCVS